METRYTKSFKRSASETGYGLCPVFVRNRGPWDRALAPHIDGARGASLLGPRRGAAGRLWEFLRAHA